MIEASPAWKAKHRQTLLPETFVEISCALTEVGVQEMAVPSATNEEFYSNLSATLGTSNTQSTPRYTTLEPNLWCLDGTMNILPDSEMYSNTGYVSNTAAVGSVTLSLDEVHTVAIPGVTINWSSEYGEYPTSFTVTAKNGNTVVAETTITDNASNRSMVYMEIANYDSVTVTVLDWCLPNRRVRIDLFRLGLEITFGKNEILSYSHEQHGCLVSGELPKNSIEFSVDNTDNRWNPQNPAGLERYLSERQRLTVRYGMDIDGTIEWIKAGVFYLSKWKAPSNGIEAIFEARDIFEFLIDAGGIGAAAYDTLAGLVDFAVGAYLPDGAKVVTDPVLKNYSAGYLGATSHAESIQKCANAAGCIIRYDRNGTLYIEPLKKEYVDYVITSELTYTYPEVELSKPLKSIAVSYKDSEDDPYVLNVSSVGEQQTVSNDYITSQEQAAYVADFVRSALEPRSTVSGEFRADPRLDLFDIISVWSKYGQIAPVVITNIKYSYSGSFKASYTGKVISGVASSSHLGQFALGISVLAGEETE